MLNSKAKQNGIFSPKTLAGYFHFSIAWALHNSNLNC